MTSTVTPSWTSDVSRRAVARLRDVVLTGGFASLAAVDRLTGDISSPEARALFSALPAITPATAPDELVDQGLLGRLPRNLQVAYERPKYFRGREVFVQTHVNRRARDRQRPVGEYRADAPLGFSHRGKLSSRRGGEFLIELEGAPDLLAVPQTDVYTWNEPCGVPPSGGALSGVQIDYNDPLLKAHVCAAYLELAQDIEALDFGKPADEQLAAQESLIARLAGRVCMRYAGSGEGYAGMRAGALLSDGQGVCFVQRAVAAGFLQAFARALAFEIQSAVGRTLRLGAPRGFVIVTLRPSMARYVCDPAWSEPLTELRVAFFGPGWGHDRCLIGFEGAQNVTVRPSEVDLPEVETP